MTWKTTAAAALVGLSLSAGFASAVQAQESVIVETIRATTYLNGGIGQDEQARMHRLAPEFPLRITFSERKDGEFLADIPVLITDSQGNPVFELPQAGPMLYVVLPPGRYKVSARFKGLTESQEVAIGSHGGKDISFHWRGSPKG